MNEIPTTSILTTPNKNDILCGRGSGPNDHIGNVSFRKLVSSRKEEYMKASSRAQKQLIAKEIIETISSMDPPGRFLEKASPSLEQEGVMVCETEEEESSSSSSIVCYTGWNITSHEKALEKVKQALRQVRHRKTITVERKSNIDLPKKNKGTVSSPTDESDNIPSDVDTKMDVGHRRLVSDTTLNNVLFDIHDNDDDDDDDSVFSDDNIDPQQLQGQWFMNSFTFSSKNDNKNPLDDTITVPMCVLNDLKNIVTDNTEAVKDLRKDYKLLQQENEKVVNEMNSLKKEYTKLLMQLNNSNQAMKRNLEYHPSDVQEQPQKKMRNAMPDFSGLTQFTTWI